MRRRQRLNLVLLAMVLLLAVLALLGRRPADLPALAFEPAAIQRIDIRFPRGGESIELQRDSAGWRLNRPPAQPAHAGRVAGLLESLRAPTASCYPLAGRDLAEFGLQPPRAVLQLDHYRVELGDRAADGRRYLRTSERLCLVEDIALPILRNGADALAQPDQEP